MIPLISAMILYIALPPMMKLSVVKIIVSIVITLFSLLLALRIKGKIVTQWLIILLRYNLRPGLYLYNKNDSYQRTVLLPTTKTRLPTGQEKEETEPIKRMPTQTIADLIRLETLLNNKAVSCRFKTNKKGGLTIALNQSK